MLPYQPRIEYPVDVDFCGSLSGFVIGRGGEVCHTTDGGDTWQMHQLTFGLSESHLSYPDPWSVYILRAGRGVVYSRDEGVSWQNSEDEKMSNAVNMDFANGSYGLFVGKNGSIVRTTDGCAHFEELNSGVASQLNDVVCVDENIAFAVGDSGAILATTDAGNTWKKQNSGTTFVLYAVSFCDARTGLAVGANGLILQTSDGGATWRGGDSLIGGGHLIGVSMFDSESAIAISQSRIYKMSATEHNPDGSARWYPMHEYLGGALTICVITPAHLVLTTSFSVRSSIDAGKHWQYDLVHGPQLIGFAPDMHTGYIPSSDGSIFHTTNGGSNWEKLVDLHVALVAMHVWDSLHCIVMGFNGAVFMTTDGGLTWEDHSIDSLLWFRGVSFCDSIVGYAMGIDGSTIYGGNVLMRTTNGGRVWSRIDDNRHLQGAVDDLWCLDPLSAIVLGASGFIFYTDNGGATVREWETGVNNHLRDIYFRDRLNGYIVGDDGAFLISTDGGITWQNTAFADTNHHYSVSFCDANNGLVTGSNVYSTTNGGVSWKMEITFDHPEFTVEQHLSAPNIGWILTSLGRVFHMGPYTDVTDATHEVSFQLQIAPQPATDVITISGVAQSTSPLSLELYDMQGNSIAHQYVDTLEGGSFNTTLSLSMVSTGLYCLKICNGIGVATERIVIAK